MGDMMHNWTQPLWVITKDGVCDGQQFSMPITEWFRTEREALDAWAALDDQTDTCLRKYTPRLRR